MLRTLSNLSYALCILFFYQMFLSKKTYLGVNHLFPKQGEQFSIRNQKQCYSCHGLFHNFPSDTRMVRLILLTSSWHNIQNK